MTFNEIELTRREMRLLKNLSKAPALVSPRNEPVLKRLYRLDLAYPCYCRTPDEPRKAAISDFGTDYLNFTLARKDQRRIESIRYWITTAIAVAALIKAFLPELSAGLAWLLRLLKQ